MIFTNQKILTNKSLACYYNSDFKFGVLVSDSNFRRVICIKIFLLTNLSFSTSKSFRSPSTDSSNRLWTLLSTDFCFFPLRLLCFHGRNNDVTRFLLYLCRITHSIGCYWFCPHGPLRVVSSQGIPNLTL